MTIAQPVSADGSQSFRPKLRLGFNARVSFNTTDGATAELRDTCAAYDHERRTQGTAVAHPKGALEPASRTSQPEGRQICPVYHGTPDQVVQAVLADPGLASADELVLFLPPGFTLDQNRRLLADLAETVAPQQGWIPAD